jgi:hypothetical protein
LEKHHEAFAALYFIASSNGVMAPMESENDTNADKPAKYAKGTIRIFGLIEYAM